VYPRGCEDQLLKTFKIRRPTTRWQVRLDPGRYELEVELSEFLTTDGRSGDASAALGLRVSENRALGLLPARDKLACAG
jgi:hypothetical protein